MYIRSYSILLAAIYLLSSCRKDQTDDDSSPINVSQDQWLVVNEGNFQWGNASLTLASIDGETNQNNAFQSVNNRPLGDVAQSVTQMGDTLCVVVNNSARVELINASDLTALGSIAGFTSPRFWVDLGGGKAVVSNMWSGGLDWVDLSTMQITDNTSLTGWSNQMITIDQKLYVENVWSNYLYQIDINTHQILDSLQTAWGSAGLAIEDGLLYQMCNGPDANRQPTLYQIDPATFTLQAQWEMPSKRTVADLQVVGAHQFAWLQSGVKFFDVEELQFDSLELSDGVVPYAMDYDPVQDWLIVTDAKDYMQSGTVHFYELNGLEKGSFTAGIIPAQVHRLLAP